MDSIYDWGQKKTADKLICGSSLTRERIQKRFCDFNTSGMARDGHRCYCHDRLCNRRRNHPLADPRPV